MYIHACVHAYLWGYQGGNRFLIFPWPYQLKGKVITSLESQLFIWERGGPRPQPDVSPDEFLSPI